MIFGYYSLKSRSRWFILSVAFLQPKTDLVDSLLATQNRVVQMQYSNKTKIINIMKTRESQIGCGVSLDGLNRTEYDWILEYIISTVGIQEHRGC
jgi:hypothetical protein